jgi:SNF2 family DNA or RNA helicase
MVVLDEAHKIKNADGGIWAQSVLTIAKYCVSRVVLTGTPIPNGFEDIFNLYNFIWPDKDIIKYHLFQLKDMTANRFDPRVKQLVDNISPFFIRIRKSDLHLPPATEHQPIIVKMGDVQRSIYDFIENSYIDYFKEQETGNKDLASTLSKARFIRLLQTATNPELLKSPIEKYYNDEGISSDLFIDDSEILSNIINYAEKEIPSKFIAVKELVESIILSGQKVIIWATFINTVKGLQSFLSDNGISSKLLIGEIPVETDSIPQLFETRESIIRDFHDPNSEFKVLIANPFAVAESISLHKVCHNAIYLERNFNASNFLQSKDRIHRVGLKPGTSTNYYYILSENSIDETVHTRLIEKERRMLDIIENQPIPLINMNMDYEVDLTNDIKALIRNYVQRTT